MCLFLITDLNILLFMQFDLVSFYGKTDIFSAYFAA